MKAINVFVGSSIDELKAERKDFADIISELNVKLKNADIFLYLDKCEYEDGNMHHFPSQNLIDIKILNSDYSYFIIKTAFHQWTKHEYEIARNSFMKNGSPHICVMFRKLDDTEQLSQEAVDFQNKLRELGYYYKHYKNNEELKLYIVLNLIVDNLLSGQKLKAEDDGLYFENIKIIDTNQIPSYSRHVELGKLQHQLAELEKKESTCENKRERRLLREQIQEVNRFIHEIESLIYQTMLNLTKASRGGITPLLKRAICFIENGDVEKASEILNKTDVEIEMDSYTEKTELSLKGIKSAIETAFIAIETLSQLPKSFERSLEIEALYQKIISLEIKYNLNRYHCGLYVRYLLNQHKYDDAIHFAWLYLESADDWIDSKHAFLETEYSLLGMVLTLEPLCDSDPERFQKLYTFAYYQYIKIYEKATKILNNDININIYTLGIHCDRLMAFLETMDKDKDDEIIAIERDLSDTIALLMKEGYHKVGPSDLNGKRDAQQLIDLIELQNVLDKMNNEPNIDDPMEYLTEYQKTLENTLQFFETSDNMYIQSHSYTERFLQEYQQLKTALESHDNDAIELLFIQCKIGHAQHYLKAANFNAALRDFEEAYKILLERNSQDVMETVLFCETCFGFSNALIGELHTQKAETVSMEGIKRLEKMVEANDQCQTFLAKLYSNHAFIVMKGRTEHCIINGLKYSEKALLIFKKVELKPYECIDAMKACYIYALILIENGRNFEALQELFCGIDFLDSVDEASQIREHVLIKGVLLETIKTAARSDRLEETIRKLSDTFGSKAINKLIKEIENEK